MAELITIVVGFVFGLIYALWAKRKIIAAYGLNYFHENKVGIAVFYCIFLVFASVATLVLLTYFGVLDA